MQQPSLGRKLSWEVADPRPPLLQVLVIFGGQLLVGQMRVIGRKPAKSLVLTAVAGPGGEICHYWTAGAESPAGAFQCPEPGKRDNAGDAFCCGTCSVSYCCSSADAGARLEQERCPGSDRLLVPFVPPATHPYPYSFYIGVGLTAVALLAIMAYLIYLKICLPLRTWVRVHQQVRQQEMPLSRVSFQDPSPTFTYSLGSRLRSPNPPPLYQALTAIRLTNPPPSAQMGPLSPAKWTLVSQGMMQPVPLLQQLFWIQLPLGGLQNQRNKRPAHVMGCLSAWDRVT
ncbi:protein shisa-3-like isoform X1 [Heteronotia binoei]|uniref:protein shisa-3-like isoform X1 n=1 Tax=Heteronotia binoei TaxID=13085 RepID=UPI00292E47D1|nr:protein shisa-3-like isoform X1 [Heteronotia binoei]